MATFQITDKFGNLYGTMIVAEKTVKACVKDLDNVRPERAQHTYLKVASLTLHFTVSIATDALHTFSYHVQNYRYARTVARIWKRAGIINSAENPSELLEITKVSLIYNPRGVIDESIWWSE